MYPDVVAGRGLEGLEETPIGRDVFGRCCWKGRQLEGLNPDGDRKGRQLEGIWVRRDGPGRCCWKRIGRDGDWKGWIQMGIGREIDWKGCGMGCCLFRLMMLLLVALINYVIVFVDCSG